MKHFIAHFALTEIGNYRVRYIVRFIFHFHFLTCRELRERVLEGDVDMSTLSTTRALRGSCRDAGLLDENYSINVATRSCSARRTQNLLRLSRAPTAYSLVLFRRQCKFGFLHQERANELPHIGRTLYVFLVDHSTNANILCERPTYRY